jgi:uncharacterized protein (DUF1810 family)
VDETGLQRFVEAQDAGGTYDTALRELRAGRKRTHWMWFVLPQVAGLGTSPNAQRYALSGRSQAQAYLDHPVLGPRLRECARVLAGLATHDAEEVLGPVDAQKLRSCMTLFAAAAPDEPVFREVLDRYFGRAGRPGHHRAPVTAPPRAPGPPGSRGGRRRSHALPATAGSAVELPG